MLTQPWQFRTSAPEKVARASVGVSRQWSCPSLRTTLLNYILESNHGKRIAIIENEFGEASVFFVLAGARGRRHLCGVGETNHAKYHELIDSVDTTSIPTTALDSRRPFSSCRTLPFFPCWGSLNMVQALNMFLCVARGPFCCCGLTIRVEARKVEPPKGKRVVNGFPWFLNTPSFSGEKPMAMGQGGPRKAEVSWSGAKFPPCQGPTGEATPDHLSRSKSNFCELFILKRLSCGFCDDSPSPPTAVGRWLGGYR